jgi:FKBP-type peptidyl-prolyl cis-trans isomerase FklB
MKRIALLATILALLTSQAMAEKQDVILSSQTDKISYIIGLNIGKNFKEQGTDVNPNTLMKGLEDGLSGDDALLDAGQQKTVMQAYQKEMLGKIQEKLEKQSEKDNAAGDAFLTANALKPGVQVNATGLQYKVIKSGKGDSPKRNDKVKVKYEGSLINGEVFDSTDERGSGKPAVFRVDQVIPGWTQALQMMRPGSVWEIYIPAKLGYGARGMGGAIPPNSVLIFKVDLVKVIKNKKNRKK